MTGKWKRFSKQPINSFMTLRDSTRWENDSARRENYYH